MCLVTGPLSGELRFPALGDVKPPLCAPGPRSPRARAAGTRAHPAGRLWARLAETGDSFGSRSGRPDPGDPALRGAERKSQEPSEPGCLDVRRLRGAPRAPKFGLALRVAGADEAVDLEARVGRALGRLFVHVPRAMPPGGARRVRGLGLGDSGRLAVAAALTWPFPAYSVQTSPRWGQGTSWSCRSVAQLLFSPGRLCLWI